MILLNKFIFGEMDQFKKDLTPSRLSARLSKDINVHNYYNDVRSYQCKKTYIGASCVAFTFKNGDYARLNLKFFAYEKHNYSNYLNIYIRFKMNRANDSWYYLTTEPAIGHSKTFSFSDENSIASIMDNIIRNS